MSYLFELLIQVVIDVVGYKFVDGRDWGETIGRLLLWGAALLALGLLVVWLDWWLS